MSVSVVGSKGGTRDAPLLVQFLPPANKVWGKVIFLHLSVLVLVCTEAEGHWVDQSALIKMWSRWSYSVADSGFSPGGCANSQNCYYFSTFCRKLHENERIWTPRGGGARIPGAPPLDPPMLLANTVTFGTSCDSVHGGRGEYLGRYTPGQVHPPRQVHPLGQVPHP